MAQKFVFNPFTGNFDIVDALGSIIAGFTDGSIPFASGGTLAEDNSNLFYDNTNDGVRINTTEALGANRKLNVGGTTADIEARFGQSIIGYAGTPGFGIAAFGSSAHNSLTNFGFSQIAATGATFVNAPSGATVSFGNPFLPVFIMDVAGLVGTFASGSSCRWAGATSGYVGLVAPAVAPSITLTLPSATAGTNTVVKVNGSNVLSFGTVANADVASGAAIAVNKLAALTGSRVVESDASGFLSTPNNYTGGLVPYGTSLGGLKGASSALKYLEGTGFGINKANPVDAACDVHSSGASTVVGRFTGFTSQSADHIRVDNISGTQLMGVDRSGLIKAARGTVGNSTGSIYGISDARDGINFSGANTLEFFTNTTTRLSTTNNGATLNSGVLDLTAGSVTAPCLTRTGDLNCGAYFPGTDQFAVTTAGTQNVQWDANGAVHAKGVTQTIAGTSTSNSKIGGVLNVNTTAVGNVGAGADDLITYTLPANSLSTNNYFVRITAFGTFAANANSKQLEMLFGSTVVYDTGAQLQNGGSWRIQATVIRTGAATQKAIAHFVGAATLFGDDSSYTTPAETLSSTVTIKCRGTGTSNDDIKQEGLIVEWYPA